MKDYHARAFTRNIVNIVITGVITLVSVFPIIWALSTSFKTRDKILEYPPRLLPHPFTLESYRSLLDSGIVTYISNSLLVSGLTLVLSLTLGFLAAYALARFQFFGKRIFMLSVVAVMSIPLASLIVPTYTFLAKIGFLNSDYSLALLYTAYQLPVTIWILYGYFQTIPEELERAAMIDGYSRLQVLVRIVLPLSKTGLVAAGLFVVTFAWNEFVVALVMLSSDSTRTLPLAIYNYLSFYGREWGPLTAASIVSIVPIIAVFIIFQRYFLSGMTGGGVKG